MFISSKEQGVNPKIHLHFLSFLPAGCDSRCVAIDNEAGESFAGRTLWVGIRSCQDEVEAGNSTVCDPE